MRASTRNVSDAGLRLLHPAHVVCTTASLLTFLPSSVSGVNLPKRSPHYFIAPATSPFTNVFRISINMRRGGMLNRMAAADI